MSPEDEATGSVLIKPVGENRRARQPKPQPVEGGFQIGAALGAAMHRQARGLVDHQHQPVAMKHARLNFLRG